MSTTAMHLFHLAVLIVIKVDGEIIDTASLNRKPRRMSHRGEFGISLKKSMVGLRRGVCADGSNSCLCQGERLRAVES